jgi:5'-methylthioadenosine phosphorylase
MCYATMAWVTDYDCWHQSEEPVSVDLVVQNLLKNVETSKELLRRVIPAFVGRRDCACESSLREAIITRREQVPEELKRKLAPIAGRYWG